MTTIIIMILICVAAIGLFSSENEEKENTDDAVIHEIIAKINSSTTESEVAAYYSQKGTINDRRIDNALYDKMEEIKQAAFSLN